MFTGIIKEVGRVLKITRRGSIISLKISSEDIIKDLKIGDSVSINGACLTVVAKNSSSFEVDVTGETLKKTNIKKLRTGDPVNLESALRLGEPIGGHFISGHIDDTGRTSSVRRIGKDREVWISLPGDLMKFVIPGGSIAINGVSLTVAEVRGNRVKIILIPHTLEMTNLKELKPGDEVNVETDIMIKGLKYN